MLDVVRIETALNCLMPTLKEEILSYDPRFQFI